MSHNDGDTWQRMSLNLPDVQISDIWVEDNALAISTMGRSFYVLDDLEHASLPAGGEGTTAAYLFAPADAIRGAGGATFTYVLRTPAQKVTLEVLDASNEVVWKAEGPPPPAARGAAQGQGGAAVKRAAAGRWRTGARGSASRIGQLVSTA